MKRVNLFLMITAFVFLSCVSEPEPKSQVASSESAAAPTGSQRTYSAAAQALVQGTPTTTQPATSSTAPANTAAPIKTNAESPDQPPPLPGVLSPEEEAFLTNYLARLQYMVYYDENAGVNPKLAKIAVGQANRYLIEKNGLDVIDFDQIEKNKKDQMDAYKAETGGSIDLIQYIAQKYNADVYVEIAFNVSSVTRSDKFYATAYGTMKMYNTSTAQLLGSVSFQSPEVFSPASSEAATSNAITASVWNGMPKMLEQSKMLIKNSMARGVRYELIIQKTPDSKAISTLRRALAKKMREVEQVSYSPSETKLAIFTFSGKDKVEDAIYDAAERAGLQNIYLVYSRGKSFTFNSGQ